MTHHHNVGKSLEEEVRRIRVYKALPGVSLLPPYLQMVKRRLENGVHLMPTLSVACFGGTSGGEEHIVPAHRGGSLVKRLNSRCCAEELGKVVCPASPCATSEERD